MDLKQFIANSPLAAAMFDTNMVYLAASQRWREDFGLQAADLLGKSHYEIFPEIPAAWKVIHQRGLRGETIQAQEDKFIRANGTEQWIRWVVQPWLREGGAIGGLVILSEDTTLQKTSERQTRLLSEIRSVFTKAESPQEVLRGVCGKILEYVDCEIFLAYLLDKPSGRLQLQAYQGINAEEIHARKLSDLAETICGMSTSQPNCVIAEDLQKHENPTTNNLKSLGLTAYACFPLESEHHVLGTIFFGSKRRARFLPSELELMSAMTDYVAVSMQRVVDRATLKDREERLIAVLNSVADAIVSIDSKGIIYSVNPATCQIFGYAERELLGQNVSILMPSPYHEKHDQYIQNYLATGQAKIIGLGRELRAKHKNGELFPVELTVTEIDHLHFFTGVIRDISERKQLQRQLLENVSTEQRRIGQELHDGIGQELTGLTLLAGSIKRLLPEFIDLSSQNTSNSDPLQLLNAANQLVQGLTETNRHARDLSHGIMPVQIDVLGLRSALEELAKKIQSQDGRLTCQVQCGNDFLVANNTVATQLYCIAQEALNNAIRHGQATSVVFVLDQDRDQIILEIQDNGIGFDPKIFYESKPSSGGFGLKIMQHRMNTIGGSIIAAQQEPQGMTIRCTLPKNQEQ